MEELPNGWTWEAARGRACDLIADADPGAVSNSVVDAFARYIAQHEQPPVDPDLMLLADILEAAGMFFRPRSIRNGQLEDQDRAALKLLKERKG